MRSELHVALGRTAARIAAAEEMPVGGALMIELERITALPMDAYLAVRVQALWGKLESHLVARRMVATSDTVRGIRKVDFPAGEAQMLAAQEIACATHIPYPTAMNHVGLVERVGECLPASWEALDRGDITFSHLKAVERATRHCSPRVAEAVDTQVIPLAIKREWTPSETAKSARKLLIALDPEGAKERAADAKNEADVQLYPGEDGMATMVAHGPADRSQQVMSAINDYAENMARNGDQRPIGVRRVDALYDLVLGGGATTGNGTGIARRVATQVRVDLTTLLGLNDQPGELVGYGAITAEATRRIAADSTLRRLITDPLTGKTLDLGLKAYRPSAALRRLVEAEHPTCGLPGCNRPAHTCQIDHRNERRDGGRTDDENLGPLCLMHHQLKTKKLWKLDLDPEGNETWTSYLGYRYTKKPAWFPLPEPLPAEDDDGDRLDEIIDRLPDLDPNPPYPDEIPLPEPPPLTDEELEAMDHAVDNLDAFGISFQQWCERHYDEARATGLIA